MVAIESLILLVGAISGALISVVSVLFSNLRKSRCTHISCCRGCVSCERELMSKSMLEMDMQSPTMKKINNNVTGNAI
jgi:hypothetical protein